MAATILATKLYVPPPPPKAVLRPRLIERLNEGLHRKLALVSAPAGFGKTTLVSEWVAALTPDPSPSGRGSGVRVAWVSLDEGDNDLARFLTYLVAALQRIAANVGERTLAALDSLQPPPTEAILTALLNEIAAIPDPFVLVLDDYHMLGAKPVEASTTIDEALAFLIEHLPPQMHLVIATREDPALPLARYRVRGQLTELRAAELRFTPAEAAKFLNQVMGLNLSVEDIAALETRTEGWIAGLQLAALAMQGLAPQGLSIQGRGDIASFIQAFTGSHHFILDYLLEEVLHQQPENVQAFLLRTSILNRLCSSLCDALQAEPVDSERVAGQETGQETLEHLERANLFIVPLDNERRWYRYHQLFGDLLRQRMGRNLASGEIAETHHRASQWYEKHGDLAEAFHHALAGGDQDRAAGLAELAWPGMNGTFQSAIWLDWVLKLPTDLVRARPVLSTQVGMAFMDAGEPEASEFYLQDAERCLDDTCHERVVTDESQLEALPAMIAITRAYNAQVQGDFSAAVKYAELALRHLPEDDLFRRAQATIMLEFTHWSTGDLEAAFQAMGHWMQSMEKAGNFMFVVASAFAAADIQVEQGRLRDAIHTYQQALQLAAEHGPEAQQVTAHHYLGLAMLYHEMGQDALRDEHLGKARELGEQTPLVDWPYRWHLAQARLKESGRDLESALALLDEARRVYVKNPVPDTRPSEALKAKVYLKQGRLDKAQDWARKQGLSAGDEISYLNEFEHLVLARVLIAEAQSSRANSAIIQADELLERLLKAAEAQKRMGGVIEVLAAQALAYQAQGNIPLARASLERALYLAQPEGYLRLFVDEGEPMQLLIADLGSRITKQANGPFGAGPSQLPAYVNKLLASFPARTSAFALQTEIRTPKSELLYPKSEMVEPLSARELEVLRLIAQGFSNTEISQRLFLAISTVKGHNLRIFGKLQVQNRTEAAARAHALGLL